MFELKILESDESDDTVRASHQRILTWCLRLGAYLLIGTALSTLGAQAAPAARPEAIGALARAGYHVWCDRVTGVCGLHDATHHRVPKTARRAFQPAAPTP